MWWILLIFSSWVVCQGFKYELCTRLQVTDANSTCLPIVNSATAQSNGTYKPKPMCDACAKCKKSNYLCEFGCESIKAGIQFNLVKAFVQNLMGDDKCIDKGRTKCESCTKGSCNECVNNSLQFYERCQKWGTAFDNSTGEQIGSCFANCSSSVKTYAEFFTCTYQCYLPGFKQFSDVLKPTTTVSLTTDAAAVKSGLDQYFQMPTLCYDQSELKVDNQTQFRSSDSILMTSPNIILTSMVTLGSIILYFNFLS